MKTSYLRAFTVVELLIVVVVLAILAILTVVSYNGIVNGAKESSLKADLKNIATKLHLLHAESGSFPVEISNLSKTEGVNYQYKSNSVDNTFCITAISTTLPGKPFRVNQNGSPEAGSCDGDVGDIAGSMQSFTSARCQVLPVYTGSNTGAIINLTDNRGGLNRIYRVAKLADNKCWMLDNLKLGSASGSIQLTNSDTDLTNKTSFTLPQLVISGAHSVDVPIVNGPVPGDTGSGATNYGYLYNFSAAVAGESRTTLPPGSGRTAPNSICPASWRLPTGGSSTSDFSTLDKAFGGTGAASNNGPGLSKWRHDGIFKGTFAGFWEGSFHSQSVYAYFWSRTVATSSAVSAYDTRFNSTNFNPVFAGDRNDGFAVRCVMY